MTPATIQTHALPAYIVASRLRVMEQAQEIIRLAQAEGCPTEGDFAAHVWMWSNSRDVAPELAIRTMTAAGYRPFVGYPLQRAHRKARP